MSTTTNLGLNIFPSSEWGTTKYSDFIKGLAGSDETSNMQIIDTAIKNILDTKQDNITGSEGQVVGFGSDGKPVAQAAPETGPRNILDGSSTGSVRSSGSTSEGTGYTIGTNAFSEGSLTKASGSSAHAEGEYSIAYGMASHAEGSGCVANGNCSHAEGCDTYTSYPYSHVEGRGTKATEDAQHVEGRYNSEETEGLFYAHILGNGTDEFNRSNAHTIDFDGNAWFSGEVFVGGSWQGDENAVKLSKEGHTHSSLELTSLTVNGSTTMDSASPLSFSHSGTVYGYIEVNNSILNVGVDDGGTSHSDYANKFILRGDSTLCVTGNPKNNVGIYVDGHRIAYLADPIYKYDAANKQYVDSKIGDISSFLDSINGEVV